MDEQVVFMLKIGRLTRDRFKEITHIKGGTMQSILSAFIESYVDNPDNYRLKLEVIPSDYKERV